MGNGEGDVGCWIVVVGLGAGALSGLFGVGGGLLMVPALIYMLNLDQRMAHGTSLAAVLPIAAAGATGYLLAGKVDWLAAGGILSRSAGRHPSSAPTGCGPARARTQARVHCLARRQRILRLVLVAAKCRPGQPRCGRSDGSRGNRFFSGLLSGAPWRGRWGGDGPCHDRSVPACQPW